MQFADYIGLDATGLADLIARREVSASEVAATAKAAIDRLNPKIGAVIETWPDAIAADLNQTALGAPFGGGALFGQGYIAESQGTVERGRQSAMCR